MKEKTDYAKKVKSSWKDAVLIQEKGEFVIYNISKTGKMKLGSGKTEMSAWQSASKWV